MSAVIYNKAEWKKGHVYPIQVDLFELFHFNIRCELSEYRLHNTSGCKYIQYSNKCKADTNEFQSQLLSHINYTELIRGQERKPGRNRRCKIRGGGRETNQPLTRIKSSHCMKSNHRARAEHYTKRKHRTKESNQSF